MVESKPPSPATAADLLTELARLSIEVYRYQRGLRDAELRRDAVLTRLLAVTEDESSVTVDFLAASLAGVGPVETVPAATLPTKPM